MANIKTIIAGNKSPWDILSSEFKKDYPLAIYVPCCSGNVQYSFYSDDDMTLHIGNSLYEPIEDYIAKHGNGPFSGKY